MADAAVASAAAGPPPAANATGQRRSSGAGATTTPLATTPGASSSAATNNSVPKGARRSRNSEDLINHRENRPGHTVTNVFPPCCFDGNLTWPSWSTYDFFTVLGLHRSLTPVRSLPLSSSFATDTSRT
jgi:hypothetical protein